MILLTELAVQAITFPFHGLALVTAVDLVAEGLLQPIEGLAVVVVAIRLLELRGEAAAPSEMARALVPEARMKTGRPPRAARMSRSGGGRVSYSPGTRQSPPPAGPRHREELRDFAQ